MTLLQGDLARMNAKLKSPEEALLRCLEAAGHSASLDLPERADGNPLKHRLLAIAGVGANVRTDDCDIESILSRGVLLFGRGSALVKMAARECHKNSAYLWDCNRGDYDLMTGYAISADSLWRQHSWCYDRRRQRVVETTERRVAYLGFRMTVNEAVWFRDNNLD